MKQKKLLQEYEEKNKQNIWSFQNKKNRYPAIENQKQQKNLINKLRRSFIVSLLIEKKSKKSVKIPILTMIKFMNEVI